MYKVRCKAVANVAQALLSIYTTPAGNSQRELAALLKMSKGGIAKLMMQLFRRGLIERVGYQHYTLTENVLGYLAGAVSL